MHAGTSAADITPTRSLRLQGHAPCAPSVGVLYPLSVGAVVFREGAASVAVVSLDVIGVSLDTTQRIRAEIQKITGIPPEHVMLCASHTHCAPATLQGLGLVPDVEWMKHVERAAVRCVVDAAERAEPVTLGLGCGAASFHVNRRPLSNTPEFPGMTRNFGGLVDRRARVLCVQKSDGSTLATLFHFSCHPTTKSGTEGLVSPDYPGVARAAIERELGGAAFFIPGCFGNVRPNITGPGGAFASATKVQLDACGHELANTVCKASRWVATKPAATLWGRTLDVKLPFGAPRDRKAIEAAAASTTDLLAPWAKQTLELLDRGALPTHFDTQVQLVRLGPVVLYAIGGEPVQEIGHAVERALSPMLDADDIWASGYSNDMAGYLCTARHYEEGGYEPTAYPWFERPLPFANEEATLVDAAVKLAR